MKKLYPIGIQSFEKLRKENYLYIDKTSFVYELVKSGSLYFLSRPRRFWKKPSSIHFRSLLPRQKGAISRSCC